MPTEKNPPYLRKKGTDQVFAFNPILVQVREDMEPWFEPTSKGNVEKIDTSANKITVIVNAISKLNPAEDFKKDKTPKAPSLTRVVGFDVTSAERDEAWKIVTEKDAGLQKEKIENGK